MGKNIVKNPTFGQLVVQFMKWPLYENLSIMRVFRACSK